MSSNLNPDGLILSGEYARTMDNTVLPFLESREKVSIVPGTDEKPLYTVSYEADNPEGTVFLVHGFTENAYKYAELIYSLLYRHFCVVAYDQRGHGRSWRDDGIPDPSVTHVGRFDDYVEDLHRICEACQSAMPKPWVVFAHSMGGGVASLFLEKYPDVFCGAVLSSPMIAPNLSGIPTAIASLIANAGCVLGRAKSNPFFMKRYSGPESFESSCATDPSRFAWYDAVKASRKEFQNSVPSYQWIRESIGVTRKLLAPGAPERISCPVLLFSAEEDSTVLPEPQKQFIARVGNGNRILVSGSRHEIFRSTDEVLFPWWHQVLDFCQKAVNGTVHGTGGQA